MQADQKGHTPSYDALRYDVIEDVLAFKAFCEDTFFEMDVLFRPYLATKEYELTFGPRNNSLIKKCFTHFNVTLRGPDKYKTDTIIAWKDKACSYTFENLKSGFYELWIIPCYSDEECTKICYRSNHTVLDASFNSSSQEQLVTLTYEEDIRTILLPLGLIALIILFVGTLFFYKRHVSTVSRSEIIENINTIEKSSLINTGLSDVRNLKLQYKNIEVYILYPHDVNTKEKVKQLKDFLETFCGFNVTLLDDELVDMLIDPADCIKKILIYKCSSVGDNCSSNKKIIIVEPTTGVSCDAENKQMEGIQDEIEENAFREAIAILGIDWSRGLCDYCHLFVIRFGNHSNQTQDLKNIVPRVRYNIPEHLINLCFNLSMNPEQVYYEYGKYLMDKLENHPIKDGHILKY